MYHVYSIYHTPSHISTCQQDNFNFGPNFPFFPDGEVHQITHCNLGQAIFEPKMVFRYQ